MKSRVQRGAIGVPGFSEVRRAAGWETSIYLLERLLTGGTRREPLHGWCFCSRVIYLGG